MNARLITTEDANHVLWHYGCGGLEPGGFTATLLTAIMRADRGNRERLRLGFPGLVAAVELVTERIGGIEELRRIAEGG